MRRVAWIAAAALAAGLSGGLLGGCIGNNIPYPVIELAVTAVEGTGFTCTAEDINPKERVVTLHLEEQTDIRSVQIDRISINREQGEAGEPVRISGPLDGAFDLRTPLYRTLSLYQDYEWTIKAEQEIERYFEVEGQFGDATFDEFNLTATAYVPQDTKLTAIRVNRLKLGPEGITEMDPQLEGTVVSFESVRHVYVTAHGRQEKWSLYVVPTDLVVQLRATPLSRILLLYGVGKSGSEMGFRYRRVGDEEWTDVPVSSTSGTFGTRLGGVEAETTYEVIAYSGESESEPQTVTTAAEEPLPNGDFETWSKSENGTWFPCLVSEIGSADGMGSNYTGFWGSGNPGAKKGSSVLTTPVEKQDDLDVRPGTTGQKAAVLETKNILNKIAAGNLFTGRFVGMSTITDGIVGFGQPFKGRPTALQGWYKYTQKGLKVGKNTPSNLGLADGMPDHGVIYIALGEWTPDAQTPLHIDTSKKDSFDPKNPAIVAYGELDLSTSVTEWTPFTLPLTYYTEDDKEDGTYLMTNPTHLIVCCSASRWGDYFTGGEGSTLWVDDFVLIYDK